MRSFFVDKWWDLCYNETMIDGKLIRQTGGAAGKIDFIYGASGMIGFEKDGTRYFYRRNPMGDVTHIYDESGTLFAEYVYDAWGNYQIKTDANGIGAINPIRYRGYYYDTETGLYYLQSRYYDPETGRFISQDDVSYLAPTHLSGLNLYAYCNDNPVMGYDPNGKQTFSINVGLSFFIFGWGFSGSLNFVWSSDEFALQFTYCDPLSDDEMFNDQVGFNIGLNLGITQTELDDVDDLVNKTLVSSGGDVLFGVDIINDYNSGEYVGWQFTGTVGAGFDGHKTVSKTKNVFKIPLINLPKRMKEWSNVVYVNPYWINSKLTKRLLF